MADHSEGPSKRQYLSAETRRESILQVADEILTRDGVAHFTIVEVASRAGISRQLVYQHFADLNELLTEVVRRRLAHFQSTVTSEELTKARDLHGLISHQLHRVLSLAPRDRQLLRNVFGDISALPRDLWPAVTEIRKVIINRWATLVDPQAQPTTQAYAKLNLVFNAIAGAWDMIADGSLSEDEAADLLLKVVESLFVIPW